MRSLARLLICLPLLAAATPALAQGRWIEGHAGIGFSGPDDTALAYADLDGRVGLLAGGRLALEFGVFGSGVEGDTPHETYGALAWSGGFGKLSAGAPRPAYDSVGRSGLETILPATAFGARQVARTRSRLTWGALYDGAVAWGLRYDAPGGPARWAVSAHQVSGTDLSVGSAGVEWSIEDWVLSAALEVSSDGRTGGKLVAQGGGGTVTGGVGGYVPATPGIDEVAEGYLTWKATDRIALSALVQVPAGGGSTLAVLAAQAELAGGRLAVGVSAEDGEAVASIGMDWKF